MRIVDFNGGISGDGIFTGSLRKIDMDVKCKKGYIKNVILSQYRD